MTVTELCLVSNPPGTKTPGTHCSLAVTLVANQPGWPMGQSRQQVLSQDPRPPLTPGGLCVHCGIVGFLCDPVYFMHFKLFF